MNAINTTSAPVSLRQVLYVIGAAIGMCGGLAVVFIGTFGLFVKPLSADLGWSRAEGSFLVTMVFLGYAIGGPILGACYDRFGARRVMAAGVAVFAASLAALGLVPGQPVLFAGICLLLGFSGAVTAPSGYILLLTKVFDKRLGLVIGLAMLGLGIGVSVMPILAQSLITQLGWRNAYLCLAALALVFGVLAFVMGLGKGIIPSAENDSAKVILSQDREGMSLGEALRSWRFWLLAMTALLISAVAFGTSAHLVSILTDRSLAPAVAAQIAGTSGAGVFMGRVGAAILMDRIFAPLVATVCCLLGGGGLYMLSILTADQSTWLFGAALMTGLLLGSEGDTMPYLSRRYFGLISFGAIYGCVIGLAAIGGMVGPLIFGRTFDVTGNYDLILRAGALIVIVSGLLLLLLGPYRYKVAEQETRQR